LIKLWKTRGFTLRQIAEAYDVSIYAIHSVVTGRTWKHVQDQIHRRPPSLPTVSG
jgi:hypothetical protein